MGIRSKPSGPRDAALDQRVNEMAVFPSPISLEQRQLDGPITIVPPEHRQDYPVRAWVTFPAITIRPAAYAIAWTPRAVRIEFPLMGKTVTAWIWASAVESLPPGARVVDPFHQL